MRVVPSLLFVLLISLGTGAQEVYQNLQEATSRISRLDSKPYEKLILEDGFYQPEIMIFKDVETHKEVWSLTRELCTDIANIERRCAWSCNGQYISFMSNMAFWHYLRDELYITSWGGYNYIANADGSKRRELWGNDGGNLVLLQDKFNNWSAKLPNVLYYPSGNQLWSITLGEGVTDNPAEALYTFPNSESKIIQEVSDWNWLLVEESGPSPNCYLVNTNRPPGDPYFCLTYPLAGEVHPGSFRFKRSIWAVTGGYEYISGGIILRFDETSVWEVGSLNIHITEGRSMDHLWYGPPDDRVGFFGRYNGQHGLYIQHPGYVPVMMANVPDGHVTWCGLDPKWFFAAVGPGTDYQPEYSRRLLACNEDTTTIEIICTPYDRRRGGNSGYDAIPRPNQSPDATKCWFHSSMLMPSDTYTGSYIAVFRKPHAPTVLDYSAGRINFTKHAISKEVKSYLVYRLGTEGWDLVAEVPAAEDGWNTSQDGTYMVTSLEWSGVESDVSSPTITAPGGATGDPVTGWDTAAPSPVTDLTITAEEPGQYRLTWTASPDPDVRYYNIYFSSTGFPEIIQQRLFVSPPNGTTEYLDWTAPTSGDVYYIITAVDRQGNESGPDLKPEPIPRAGEDQTVSLPDAVVELHGTVTDDGLPDPPGEVTTVWAKVSSPGPVNILDPYSLDTTVIFYAPGTYVMKLVAYDGEHQTFDQIVITVEPAPFGVDAWYSATDHSRGIGEALLEIPDGGTFSEPRAAGIGRLLVSFNAAIDPTSLTPAGVQVAGLDIADQPVNLAGVTTSVSTRGDAEGVITFTPALPDYARYLVRISGVRNEPGDETITATERIMTTLCGDVSGDLQVNASDLSQVRAARANPIAPAETPQVRADVSCDGRVNATDLSRVCARRGNDAAGISDPTFEDTPYQETGGFVEFQAEGYHDNVPQGGHSWDLMTSPAGYLGSGAMLASPDSGTSNNTGYVTNSPRLDWQVQFQTTGTYYVQVRGWAIDNSSDSCHAGLDGQGVDTADRISGFAYGQWNQWVWCNSTMDGPAPTLEVASPALHTVNIWMREDGFTLDKVILTTDPGYSPS